VTREGGRVIDLLTLRAIFGGTGKNHMVAANTFRVVYGRGEGAERAECGASWWLTSENMESAGPRTGKHCF